MPILINQNTKVIVQGITGKEGQKAVRAMLDYGTTVIAGVRPGKAGESVEGLPVFDMVQDVMNLIASDAKQSALKTRLLRRLRLLAMTVRHH